MSAHDDAMRVVIHDFAPHDPWELEQIVKAYLGDLPPSVVIDGKAVGLAEVAQAYWPNGGKELIDEWARFVTGLACEVGQ